MSIKHASLYITRLPWSLSNAHQNSAKNPLFHWTKYLCKKHKKHPSSYLSPSVWDHISDSDSQSPQLSQPSLHDDCKYWNEELRIRGSSMRNNGQREPYKFGIGWSDYASLCLKIAIRPERVHQGVERPTLHGGLKSQLIRTVWLEMMNWEAVSQFLNSAAVLEIIQGYWRLLPSSWDVSDRIDPLPHNRQMVYIVCIVAILRQSSFPTYSFMGSSFGSLILSFWEAFPDFVLGKIIFPIIFPILARCPIGHRLRF